MADRTQGFTRRVETYIKYRPRYPQAVLELLTAECGIIPAHVVADIGCGTGLLAELFLRHGNRVFGVEPDPTMRAGAEHYLRAYPRFVSTVGTAEATTLPDRSVDVVSAGQAFHWFNPQLARKEFARILAPQGWVVLVWNIQRTSGTPFLSALAQFWHDQRFWNRAKAQAFGAQAWGLGYARARQEILEPFFSPGTFKDQVFENPLVCDFAGLQGRVFSTRPALDSEEPGYAAMLEALEKLFQEHQEHGTVTIDHDTRVIYGQLAPA